VQPLWERTNVIQKGPLHEKGSHSDVLDVHFVKSDDISANVNKTVFVRLRTKLRAQTSEVKRTMEEFFLLRKHLLRAYPYAMVPALPQRFKPSKIQATKIRLGRFLASLMRSDLFKADRLLLFFLTEPDSQVGALTRELKRAPTDFGPFNVFTVDG